MKGKDLIKWIKDNNAEEATIRFLGSKLDLGMDLLEVKKTGQLVIEFYLVEKEQEK